MTPEEIAAKEAADAAAAAKEETSSLDPVQAELEKEQRRGGHTEAEKAAFSLKKTAERLKELGGDPAAILGVTTPSEEDNAPVTVGMLRKIEAERAQKTALQQAEDIPDVNERELTKHYLATRIVPSGDPAADLRMARSLVNAVKNTQIIEETQRKTDAPKHATGGGGRSKAPEDEFVATAEEASFMRSFGLTKEQVIAARPK